MAVRARATSSLTGPTRRPAIRRQPTMPERPSDGRGAPRGPSGISARSTPRPRDAGNLGRGKSLQPEGDGSELARIRASQTAVLRLPLGLIGHSPTPCFRLTFRLLAGVGPFRTRRPSGRDPDMGQASITASLGGGSRRSKCDDRPALSARSCDRSAGSESFLPSSAGHDLSR